MTAGARREAVIDIGSNSVRLVIYEGPARAPFPIVNEKALCGLGRDMGSDGALEPKAVEFALETLRRYRRILDEHGGPKTRVFATAAVREAKDGKAFVRRIDEIGFSTRVIGGSEEAELAALGVVSFEPGATGVVGDMGGGSLELVALHEGAARETVSLSIGPLRLMQASGERVAEAGDIAAREVRDVKWLRKQRFETLYSVGGAWRAIARIHMRIRSYPLSVLHRYEMPRAEAISVCDLLTKQSKRSLEDIPGLPKRRIDTLPYAAAVLRAVLEETAVQTVVVSAGGAREGLLYRDLSPETRARDPLLAGARFFAERLAPDLGMGPALERLTDPLFADETPAHRRLRQAVAALTDVAAYFHPDLRAEQAFDTALRAPFYGVTHKERIQLALALFIRHEGVVQGAPDVRIVSLLGAEERARATRIGLAIRFACALAPKASHALDGVTLLRQEGRVVFRAPKAVRSLMGEIPRKRLENLADEFGSAASEHYY
jgi:exopolyphosphatase/guanosine-5'-triphosphate,3'-diphosphate pyrophosphatase